MDSELLLKAASLFLEAASRRRKAEQETLKDEDFCLNPGDPHVVGKHRHYPIYDEHSAKRSIAQVKGLASIPAWWDDESTVGDIKKVVFAKVHARYPELDIDSIKPISGKRAKSRVIRHT